MRIFQSFSETKKCPICGTNDNKECVLVSIAGTQDGFTCEAELIHLECIELTYYPDKKMIAQKWEEE